MKRRFPKRPPQLQALQSARGKTPVLPPDPATAQRAYRALRLMMDAIIVVPAVMLRLGEQRQLAGALFPRGAEFVDRVVEGLKADPEAFPDMAVGAAELRSWQEGADAWLGLREFFRGMLDLAEENYTYCQAGAIRAAREVTRRVVLVADNEACFPHLDAGRRGQALEPALLVEQEVKQAVVARRGRSAAPKAGGAGRGSKAAKSGAGDLAQAEIKEAFQERLAGDRLTTAKPR